MAIIRVSSQAQLVSAIKNVRGGDTIALASGTYEGFSANNFSFSQKVTITSANPGAPAVINSFLLRGAGNVEFKNLKLDYNPSKSGDNPFWLEGARNVSLVNVDIEGHVASGFGKGVGLRIKNSNGVTLRDSEIAEFRNGIFASGSTNVDLINNDFRGMSNDGMLLAGMVDMLIQGNDFRNMKSPSNIKHKDMIQFMTGSGEPGSRDIVIRDNVIENKEVSHGIFFTNSPYNSGNAGAFHRNILIEDNLIRSNQVHGISVNHGDGVTIRDNVVLQVAGGSNTPLINVSSSSRNVTIIGNEVASVPREQHSSWTVSGNDTGSKDRQHWYSDGSPPASSSRVAAASLAVAAERRRRSRRRALAARRPGTAGAARRSGSAAACWATATPAWWSRTSTSPTAT